MNEVSYEGMRRPEAVRDLSQALTAQHVADPAATEELARNFLARVQRDVDEQVDLRVQQQLATWQGAKGPSKKQREHATELMLGSLGIGVPLTLFAGIFGGIWGIVVVWIGLVIINVAWARRH